MPVKPAEDSRGPQAPVDLEIGISIHDQVLVSEVEKQPLLANEKKEKEGPGKDV